MSFKNAALLVGLLVPGLAQAATMPAFAPTPTLTSVLGNPPYTIGFEFQVNSAYTVNELGIYDAGSDGLVDTYNVGLFNSSGTLISSATVSSGAGATLVNGFRYVSIAPTNLLAGESYYVGAVYTTGDDPLIFSGTVSSVPALTYLGGRYIPGSDLQAPTFVGEAGGYFGPNISGMSTVPLPAAAPMFGAALLGLAVLGYAAKRRQAAVA